MIWVVLGVVAIMAVGGTIGALIVHFYVAPRQLHVTPSPPVAPSSEPAPAGPTHVMPSPEIRQRVRRKYATLPDDRQDQIAQEIQRAAAGVIPGARPRPKASR